MSSPAPAQAPAPTPVPFNPDAYDRIQERLQRAKEFVRSGDPSDIEGLTDACAVLLSLDPDVEVRIAAEVILQEVWVDGC